ncbi:FxLYD domain-containing protein [Cellvibrio sp. QJXJ]|uniref:FxLYD domain-containing protein n=1 Tax=Cellvibrio sp. QJXJ TaxID=2964606 RepID=UPI0021C421C6|nr:FxLYD domain-containing protein [Cellvibrio sp. QJXJ]UUA72353.1 FxLYD domain-containing protein [Cellvibrio sp. QJXJ]
MNFIKSIIFKIGIGFLYGAGFAVAIVVIVSISFSKFSERSMSNMSEGKELKKDLKTEREFMFREYDESANLVTEITKERISENEFTLLGTLKNNGNANWSSINLKAELFNKDGEFIETCSEYISDKSSPGSSINFKLSCGNCSKLQLEEYHSYKLTIAGAHFNMK